MVHIAYPFDLVISQDETYASGLNCLNNLSDEDSEITIRRPAHLGPVQQNLWAQVQHPIYSEIRQASNWTAKEDKLLVLYIQLKGNSWSGAARFINRKLHRGLGIRSSNCCRERWRNHLRAIVYSGRYLEKRWTYEEDILLLDLYNTFGDSWRCIARRMPGRSKYAIKKRYNKLMIYRWQFESDSSTVASDSSSTEENLHLKTYIE